MHCTTDSVRAVADNTKRAAEQLQKLQDMINDQCGQYQEQFSVLVTQTLSDASITDGLTKGESFQIKTEYLSEFSLDKMAAVVIEAIEYLCKMKDPGVPDPIMSDDAKGTYIDMVNCICEAAKSSATGAASQSYSATRVSPGIWVFLFAFSVNIKDESTFGSEAVTTTGIFYRIIQSIDDLQNQAEFLLAKADYRTLMITKEQQALLVDRWASGEITYETWDKLDKLLQARCDELKERLDRYGWPTQAFSDYTSSSRVIAADALLKVIQLIHQKPGAEECIQRTVHRFAIGYWN